MEYNYYGSEQTGIYANNNDYPGINTPQDLYEALWGIWCERSCSPRLRPEWSLENRTLGQCSITSFLVQDIFGGRVYGVLTESGAYHCYNEVNGVVFDITSQQFQGKEIEYKLENEQIREERMADPSTLERYQYLCDKLHKYCER